MANDYGTYCDHCMALLNSAKTIQPTARPFSSFCPPCFEDTDPKLLPCPHKSEKLLRDWSYSQRGINAWGWPGTGKTRTISILINTLHKQGLTIVALAPGDFEAECARRHFQRHPWLRKLSTVDILFIDDFDKMNLTKEMEKSLFQVLNYRMGRKPVLLTHNSTAGEIEYGFRLGKSLVRRIRDTCLSVHFGQQDICKMQTMSLPLPP